MWKFNFCKYLTCFLFLPHLISCPYSRSWCTRSDGSLLLFFMTVLQYKMNRESEKFREEYQQAFEQCVFCLYGHPNRKGKAKHLQVRNVRHIIVKPQPVLFIGHLLCIEKSVIPDFFYRKLSVSKQISRCLLKIERFQCKGHLYLLVN